MLDRLIFWETYVNKKKKTRRQKYGRTIELDTMNETVNVQL